MLDLIIFSVQNNRYGLDLDGVQRVIQSPELTSYPNAHPLVEGMMSYESQVIKVLSFRKMTELELYEQELIRLFDDFAQEHEKWYESFKDAVDSQRAFNGVMNPHDCNLGKWMDAFTSHDDETTKLLKSLNVHHKMLYSIAEDILKTYPKDSEIAAELLNVKLHGAHQEMVADIERFKKMAPTVCNSLQKLLLFRGENGNFAIKVDDIIDIAHVDEAMIKKNEATYSSSDFLELEGVLELDGTLINIIKSVRMPISEVA